MQPLKPVKSEPRKIEPPPQPDVSKSEPTKASETKEEVLTQDNAESIAIKNKKKQRRKRKLLQMLKLRRKPIELLKRSENKKKKRKS